MKLIFCIFFLFFPAEILCQCSGSGVEFQNRCYIFYENASNFYDAEFACLDVNGHLVSFHDGFTNGMIASQSKNFLHSTKEFWIGLNTLTSPGNWSWTDNTIFDFEDWSASEPQNVSQSCVSIAVLSGLWKSNDCLQTKAYACEISLTTFATTTTTISSVLTTAFMTSPTTSSSPSYPAYMNCTEGWVYFEPTHSCYGHDGYDPHYENWSFGEQYCESVGGHLPSLHSYDEARFLTTLMQFTTYDLWMGLISYDNEVSWSWSDDSPVDYLSWASGYPRLNASSCVYLETIAFYDYNCASELHYICKKPAANVTNLPTKVVTPSYPAYINCTEGWVYFQPTHSCYGRDGYDPQFGNWYWGEQYCESVGGHLPSLHSYDEARFLSTAAQFSGAVFWTGLLSYDNEISWKWSDHSPVDYLPWAPGSPKLNVSSCAYLYKNAIYDYNCTNTFYVICQKSVASIKLVY